MRRFRKALILGALVLFVAIAVSCRTQTIAYGEDLENPKAALIFYPGGKVDEHAYERLCTELSSNGLPVYVVSMPLDYAFLNINGASDVIKQHPEVGHWFIAGHSLGGAMAAIWASRHQGEVEGVILLAAYSTKDLDLPVLSIYGSNDGVLNMEKYRSNRERLSDLEEHVIDGGNHCQFGDYGFQKGDNEASIRPKEQVDLTVGFIENFMDDVLKHGGF